VNSLPTSPFSLGRFSLGTNETCDGVMIGDRVVMLADTPAATVDVFEDWERLFAVLSDWVGGLGSEVVAMGWPLAAVKLHPPVRPGQVFQAGANYREHLLQIIVSQPAHGQHDPDVDRIRSEAASLLDERAARGEPFVILGLPSAMCASGDDIVLPQRGFQHDWELELGVVIGRRARHVLRGDALHYVAGYTIANDITTRDLVGRPDIPGIDTDFLVSKNAPTFLPTGPYLVPAAFVDPTDLRLTLRLNGEIMQDAKTSDMLFDVARLIEYVSSITDLVPGDLLLTGSPAGNGVHHGRFLHAGDVLAGTITGLGELRNQCVSA
jgi:2,4-didehydro-3-deoxy-L-rhamnonate hydrolase